MDFIAFLSPVRCFVYAKCNDLERSGWFYTALTSSASLSEPLQYALEALRDSRKRALVSQALRALESPETLREQPGFTDVPIILSIQLCIFDVQVVACRFTVLLDLELASVLLRLEGKFVSQHSSWLFATSLPYLNFACLVCSISVKAYSSDAVSDTNTYSQSVSVSSR